MARVIQRRIRKRGFFGWLFLVLFVLWNVASAAVFVVALSRPAPVPYSAEALEASRPGYAIGEGLAIVMILVAWAAGAIVLGLPTALIGRKTVVIEE